MIYADFFYFPWLKYRVDAPSRGYELHSQINYSVKNKYKASLRYKLEEKEQNEESGKFSFLEPVRKQSMRGELSYMISRNFQLRNRAELASYKKGQQKSELGFFLSQDVIYNPMQTGFSGNIRFAIFEIAILPFLPDRQMGPLDAWNPHKLWSVVVLVSGLSFR